MAWLWWIPAYFAISFMAYVLYLAVWAACQALSILRQRGVMQLLRIDMKMFMLQGLALVTGGRAVLMCTYCNHEVARSNMINHCKWHMRQGDA